MAHLHYYRETPGGGTQNKRSRPSNNSNNNSIISSSSRKNNSDSSNKNEYCQAVGNNSSKPPPTVAIPLLFSISGLSQQDVCDATLQRIHQEFLPIIQRRKYNIKSISEMCCCKDGLKGSRIIGNNVWGYNSISTTTTRGNRGRRQSCSSSRIHLRLRDPRTHSRLLSWEDVAGTMAHEMAHCVYQNHDKNFFKLMEEILEEHFQNQIYYGHTTTIAGPRGSVGGNITSSSSSIPESGGHKLGRGISSSTASTASKNRSRLVHELNGGGYKLGGGNTTTNNTTTTVTGLNLNRDQLRQRMVQAAEARKRQMAHLRWRIERSKESSCVIDLCDSDNDNEDDVEVEEKYGNKSEKKKKETGNNDDNKDDKIIIIVDDGGDEDDSNNNDEKKKPSYNSDTKENRSSSSSSSSISSSGKQEINSNRKNRTQPTKDKKQQRSITVTIDDDNNDNEKSEKEQEDDSRNHNIKKARRKVVDDHDVIDLTTATTTATATMAYTDINIPRTISATATSHAKNNQSSNTTNTNSNNDRWSCRRCTFKNDFQDKHCQMCHES